MKRIRNNRGRKQLSDIQMEETEEALNKDRSGNNKRRG